MTYPDPDDQSTWPNPQEVGPFEYAADLCESVEQSSCIKGCCHAIEATADMPGGSCEHLCSASFDEPVPFVYLKGAAVCVARQVQEEVLFP